MVLLVPPFKLDDIAAVLPLSVLQLLAFFTCGVFVLVVAAHYYKRSSLERATTSTAWRDNFLVGFSAEYLRIAYPAHLPITLIVGWRLVGLLFGLLDALRIEVELVTHQIKVLPSPFFQGALLLR